MTSKREKCLIISIFSLSIILMSLGFITMNNSFAITNEIPKEWNVSLNINDYNDNNIKTIVNNNRVDFSIDITELKDYTFNVSLNNLGSYSVEIKDVIKENLSNMIENLSIMNYYDYKIINDKENVNVTLELKKDLLEEEINNIKNYIEVNQKIEINSYIIINFEKNN